MSELLQLFRRPLRDFRWGVLPYLEYAFLKRVVRPFLMVMLGFEGHVDKVYEQKAKFWEFVFGGGGGLHFFGTPAVSVDLTLLVGFSAGGGGFEYSPTGGESQKTKFTRIIFRLTGMLGVSGWF